MRKKKYISFSPTKLFQITQWQDHFETSSDLTLWVAWSKLIMILSYYIVIWNNWAGAMFVKRRNCKFFSNQIFLYCTLFLCCGIHWCGFYPSLWCVFKIKTRKKINKFMCQLVTTVQDMVIIIEPKKKRKKLKILILSLAEPNQKGPKSLVDRLLFYLYNTIYTCVLIHIGECRTTYIFLFMIPPLLCMYL